MLQQGTTLDNNKYRIEGVIGRGGFGYVYRARERLTGELVAVKELVPNFVSDPQMVQRFIREARATLRLTHPHIARTYGIFQDRDTYYLAMEYLPGGSLADRLKQGPLPVETAVGITADLCEALAYAHGQGVIHCDIKPDNVLFDANGEAHLADFGIAHVSERMMTRQLFTATGVTMGTVRYMAPEQLEGVRDDPRLDVYAMGAMLHEMLAGRPYLDFETDSTPASQMRNIQRIQSEPPRSLQTVGRVPPWLAQVVDRALRKAPEERFASASALRQALLGAAERPKEQEPLPATRAAPEPPPAEAPTPAPPDTAPRSKGLPSWLWIAAGGIGLLVIGCFLTFLLIGFFSEIESAEEPTSTLRPSRTPAPVRTATRIPTSTPTSVPTTASTATSAPRPTTTPASATGITPEEILLQDTFDANDNDWTPTQSKDDEWWRGTKTISDGQYIWRIDEARQSVVHRETPIEAPDDCYISVDAQRVTGPLDTACYMLVYRKGDDGYYRFEVCDSQHYRVQLRYEEDWQKLIAWQKSETIRPGEANNLAVNAVGDRFEFFINGQLVDSIDDATLASGKAGIAMTVDKGDAATFAFDNFVLRAPGATAGGTPDVILRDTFDADDSGWRTGPRDSEYWRGRVDVTGGELVWNVEEVYQDFASWNLPDVDVPDDFHVSVDVQYRSAVAPKAFAGLVYRKNADGYYRFNIWDGGQYNVSLRYEEEWVTLLDWTDNDAIRAGEMNHIAVRAIGENFTFFINDQLVDRIADDTLSSGDVGLAIDANEGDEVVFVFDNFVLRELQ